jgi:hypothetical protein
MKKNNINKVVITKIISKLELYNLELEQLYNSNSYNDVENIIDRIIYLEKQIFIHNEILKNYTNE